MDDRRFDDLTRRLAQGVSRRTAVKGGVAALLGAVGLRGHSAAQVTQAQCGNQLCASNPGGCRPGCVCCVYPNGNSRCMPPGNCSGSGVIVVPTTTPAPTTPPPTTTLAPTTPPPPTTTTTAPTTTTTTAPTTTTTTTASTTTTTAPTTTTAAPTSTTTTAPTTTTTATPTTTTTAPPDDGLACTETVCDPDTGCAHVLQAGFCLIEGSCYAAGALNPENGCQACNPDQNQRQWTVLLGTPCGDGCLTNGTCQIRGTGTGGFVVCVSDESPTSGCAIGGVCYPAGALRPSDPCRVCDPARSQINWSLQDDDTPCETACRTGICLSGVCNGGTVAPGFCHIAGVCRRAGETDPVGGTCRVCDPARNPDNWSTLADDTPCSNLCVTNATCQSGVCTGDTPVVCEQPTDLKLCEHVVCDPQTGGCVRRPLPNGRIDIKDCVQCGGCFFGVCTGTTQPVDCGDCGVCDQVTGTCSPKLVGADCGSDCTTSRTCNSAGQCISEPGSCGINVGCEAKACDTIHNICYETGVLDGQPCGASLCHECQNGNCVSKCGPCHTCNPANGQCTPCEPCCDGICGQSTCGSDDNPFCCWTQNACCTQTDGRRVCNPKDTVCEGVCFRTAEKCCGRRGGQIHRCGLDQICCNHDIRGCCPATQVCGTFGCASV